MHISTHPAETSRRNTTALKSAHLYQLPLGASLGSRGWTRRALHLRVAESRQDRAEVAEVVKQRHYLKKWPAKPRTLLLSYIGSLGGEGAAAVVMVGMMPVNLGGLLPTLGVHQAETLQLLRCWKADDLVVDTAPDFMPQVIRSVVRRVAADWETLKCKNLRGKPRLLVSFADPGVGHDGGLYLGSGAVSLGAGKSGRLAFAWPLDETLRQPLRSYAARARA